jgi:hypothetical protein
MRIYGSVVYSWERKSPSVGMAKMLVSEIMNRSGDFDASVKFATRSSESSCKRQCHLEIPGSSFCYNLRSLATFGLLEVGAFSKPPLITTI